MSHAELRHAIARAVAQGNPPSGPLLRAVREHAGLSQQDLGELWGGTQGAVAHHEAGRRRPGTRAASAYWALFRHVLADASQSSSISSAEPER